MNKKTQTCDKAVAREKAAPMPVEQKQTLLCDKPAAKQETNENQEGMYWWQRGQYA